MKVKQICLQAFVATAVCVLATGYTANAQISFGGQPASFEESNGSLRSASAANIASAYAKLNFNPDDLKAQNEWNGGEMATKPLIIGGIIPLDVDFAKSATRQQLANGTVIYRLKVFTNNSAKAISLYYKDFFIPAGGGQLFIYTPNHDFVLGAYTHETHPRHEAFATEILPGSELVMEYVCSPLANEQLPSIKIDGVQYVFNESIANGIAMAKNDAYNNKLREYDPSENENMAKRPMCTVNANCPDGDEWYAEKASVVQIFISSGNYGGYCSGTLLNNTNQDFTPYIITAGHCIGTHEALPTNNNFDRFVFAFHYIKSGCSNASTSMGTYKTMVGCTPMAYSSISKRSDGLLLRIKDMIPESYRVYYSGWDHSSTLPNKLVGLHHPGGDAMKISYYKPVSNAPVTTSTWSSRGDKNETIKGGENDHFYFRFTKGDTFGGSSGSGLWNADHKLVGTLSGGSDGMSCNEGTQLYGRLFAHWDKYASVTDPATNVKAAMKSFLDPSGNGTAMTLNGTWRTENARTVEPIKYLSVVPNFKKNEIKVSWEDIKRNTYPSHWKLTYQLYRNGEFLKEFDANTTTFTESFKEATANASGENAVFYGVVVRYSFESTPINGDKYNGNKPYTYTDSEMVGNGVALAPLVMRIPVNSKVNKEGTGSENGEVQLDWKPASNMQEISVFGYPEKNGGKLELKQMKIPHLLVYDYTGHWVAAKRVKIGSRFNISQLIDPVIDKENNKMATTTLYYVNSVRVIPAARPAVGEKYSIEVYGSNEKSAKVDFEVPKDWKPGEFIEVKLNRPFKIDPTQELIVAFVLDNAKSKTGSSAGIMVYPANETDRSHTHYGVAIGMDNSIYYSGATINSIGLKVDLLGYPAIRPIITTSGQPSDVNAPNVNMVAKTNIAVPLPKILGYRMFRNGKLITLSNNGKDYYNGYFATYRSADIKKTDTYEAEVVYDVEDPSQLSINNIDAGKIVAVFPTKLASDGIINIENANLVSELIVYSLNGTEVKRVINPSAQVSLSELAEGNYVVVLKTATGNITTNIVR